MIYSQVESVLPSKGSSVQSSGVGGIISWGESFVSGYTFSQFLIHMM